MRNKTSDYGKILLVTDYIIEQDSSAMVSTVLFGFQRHTTVHVCKHECEWLFVPP